MSIVLVAAATGAAVSVSGVIGFVGIVVPHLLRLAIGPAHRLLLPASLLLGASLLLAADTFARVSRRARRASHRHRHGDHRRAVLPRAADAPARADRPMSFMLEARGLTLRAGRQDAARRRLAVARCGRARRAGRAERRRQVDPAARRWRANCAERRHHLAQRPALAAYAPSALALHRAVLSQSIRSRFRSPSPRWWRWAPATVAAPRSTRWSATALAEVDLAAFGRSHHHDAVRRRAAARASRARPGAARLRRGCRTEPGLLLLDEPTASLDLRHQLDVLDAVRRCAERGVGGGRGAARPQSRGTVRRPHRRARPRPYRRRRDARTRRSPTSCSSGCSAFRLRSGTCRRPACRSCCRKRSRVAFRIGRRSGVDPAGGYRSPDRWQRSPFPC